MFYNYSTIELVSLWNEKDIICAFCFSICEGQGWDSLGGGVKSSITGKVSALCIYNNNLVVGGEFDTVGNIPTHSIAQWNGTTWNCIQTGPEEVYSLLEYNGNLVAGSGESGFSITTIPGRYGDIIGQWNGTFWDTIGSGINGILPYPTMYSLCEYFGNLYAGGIFNGTTAHISYNSIVRWNGITWDTLPRQDTIGEVNIMTVYIGTLYVGGILFLDRSNNIAAWNGSIWSAAGRGVNGHVYSLAVYGGKLYVGGAFDSAGGMPAKNIATWDGSVWSAVGKGINDTVYALTPYGSVLIAGGLFDSAGGASCDKIALWDGTSWSSLGRGITGKGVYSLCNDNGNLFVGGVFDTAGGIRVNNIAQWRSPLGIKNIQNNFKHALIYPNPSSGIFTLSLSNPDSYREDKCVVEIYDVLGEQVLKETLRYTQGDNLINLSGQPNGIYLYKVINEDGDILGSGKVVIAK